MTIFMLILSVLLAYLAFFSALYNMGVMYRGHGLSIPHAIASVAFTAMAIICAQQVAL